MDYLNQLNQTLDTYVHPQATTFLSTLGLVYLTTKSIKSVRAILALIPPKGYDLPQRYGPGSWAVITGGAAGVGASFANQLGAKGFNLVLLDFNKENITSMVTSLNKQYPGIQVKPIVCDFTSSWEEGFYDGVLKNFEGLDISILVNNVGIGFDHKLFHEASEETLLKILTVNTLPLTILSKRLLPFMLERPGRAAIVNMSSLACQFPYPNEAVYSATKAYIDTLSRMIGADVRNKIDVISIRPGLMSTLMTGTPVAWNCLSPDPIVETTLRSLGKYPYTYGHWKYAMGTWVGDNPFVRMYVASQYKIMTGKEKKP